MEKPLFERYKDYLVDQNKNIPSLFFSLGEIIEMSERLTANRTFPILIDSQEVKTTREIDGVLIIVRVVQKLKSEWLKIFGKKMPEDFFKAMEEGMFNDVLLKQFYISENKIEEKYPEVMPEKLLDIIRFPDFSEILKSFEVFKHEYFMHSEPIKGICSMMEIAKDTSEAKIKELKKAIVKNNSRYINSQTELDQLLNVLNFCSSYLLIIQKSNINHSISLEEFCDFLRAKKFLDFTNKKVNIRNLTAYLELQIAW